MSTRAWLLLALGALSATAFDPTAWADGMVFRPPHPLTAEVQAVEVGAQRGVVWQQHGALDVWIEPVYAWEGDDVGAWVVPLPAVPTVLEGDPRVLDDLDALTAPTFVSVCWEPDCHEDCGLMGCLFGGSGSADGEEGGGDGEAEPRGSAVTVWSSGTVGALDYHVISADDTTDVSAWLAANGYALSDGAAEALATLTAEGTYFFVARVSAPPTPGQSLAPVVFRFAPTVAPFYPVRLTAAAMQPATHLDVTLWLLSYQSLVPEDDDWVYASTGYPTTDAPAPADYETSIDTRLAGFQRGGFVAEFSGALSEARVFGDSRAAPSSCQYATDGNVTHCVDAWGEPFCDGWRCGSLDPISLGSDVKARVRDAETPYAVRVRGRLPAGVRTTEWTFVAPTGDDTWRLQGLTGVYLEDRGDCYDCPPPAGLFCQPADTRPAPSGPALLALAVALLGLVGAGWRQRRRG